MFQNVVTGPVKSNIFQNVIISPEALKQKLPTHSKKDKNNLETSQIIKDAQQSSKKQVRIASGRPDGIPMRRKTPFHEGI